MDCRQRLMKWAALLLTVVLFSWSALACAAEKMIGQMVWTKGSVTASAPGVMPRNLQRSSQVNEGETITTGQDGTGQIVFTDGSLVSLRSNTTLELTQYNYAPEGDAKQNHYVLNLVEGGFRTVTGLVAKKNVDGYQVKTPVATIGVRGTDYTVVYSQVEGLSVKLDRGAINVSNQAGQVELDQKTAMIFSQIKTVTQTPIAESVVPSSFKEQAPPVAATPPSPTKGSNGGLGASPTGKASIKSPSDNEKPSPPASSSGPSGPSGSSGSSGSTGGSSPPPATGGGNSSQSIQVTPSSPIAPSPSGSSTSNFCISQQSSSFYSDKAGLISTLCNKCCCFLDRIDASSTTTIQVYRG